MPVELLRDQHGVYGIGVSDTFDYEAHAWACDIETVRWEYQYPGSLIIRPDRLADTSTGPRSPHAVLQKISGGFRHSMFKHSIEEQLRRFIHHDALGRAGLPWPPRHPEQYWSADEKQQVRNRGIYHGLRRLSLHVINTLIGKALEEAADPNALKAARRFPFVHREHIYRASALSSRALQLINSFPVLGLTIYSNHSIRPWIADFADWRSEYAVFEERKRLAADLVERGARLREVAAVMAIPMVLQRITPGAAHLASNALCQHPQLLDFMPKTLPRSRIWLRAVDWAHRLDAGFGEWAAREVPHIQGRALEVASILADIGDWVRAGINPQGCGQEQSAAGRQFVTRPFTRSMSLKTVTALSADWHEAVASQLVETNLAFPTPWYSAAIVNDFQIVPLASGAEVYREGAAMHHCVSTYVAEVQGGGLYLYSVRRDNERVATLALTRHGDRPWLSQIRGPCNSEPTKEVVSMVRRWLRAQGALPKKQGVRRCQLHDIASITGRHIGSGRSRESSPDAMAWFRTRTTPTSFLSKLRAAYCKGCGRSSAGNPAATI